MMTRRTKRRSSAAFGQLAATRFLVIDLTPTRVEANVSAIAVEALMNNAG
jgi:hypothetical protein